MAAKADTGTMSLCATQHAALPPQKKNSPVSPPGLTFLHFVSIWVWRGTQEVSALSGELNYAAARLPSPSE